MMRKKTNSKEKKTVQDKSPIVFQRDKISKNISIDKRPDLNETQKQIIEAALDKNVKCIIIDGVAGSGKSYTSILSSLELLNQKKVGQIIYVRSLVQSKDGETGFLTGDLEEKTKYYNIPLYQTLEELISGSDIDYLNSEERIITYPTSMLRSYNFHNSAIIGEECFPGDAYVQGESKKYSMTELFNLFRWGKEMPKIYSFNELEEKFELDTIVNVKEKGEKQLFNIKTTNLKSVRCTGEHKFLTINGWISASDLKPGDILVSRSTENQTHKNALNSDQRQIFLGGFLGDGSVGKVNKNSYRMKFIHGMPQIEYCKWKAHMFQLNVSVVEKNGYSQKPAVAFGIKSQVFDKDFILDQKQECPDWILDELDARGLAIWYMDDGSINNAKNLIRLYTCSFNLDSHNKFVKYFKEKFDIECCIRTDNSKENSYMFLNFNAENTRKLLKIVSPYMHSNIEYKTNLPVEQYKWNNNYLDFTYSVVKSLEKTDEIEKVYDIEVAKNHNFIVSGSSPVRGSGLVAHNCQNMSWDSLYTIATRAGMFSKLFFIGDSINQNDLGNKSGFKRFCSIFSDQESMDNGFRFFKLTSKDIVRSPFVKFVVEKVEKYDSSK